MTASARSRIHRIPPRPAPLAHDVLDHTLEDILALDHLGRAAFAWCMIEPTVSRMFEISALSFERRLHAAVKVEVVGDLPSYDPVAPSNVPELLCTLRQAGLMVAAAPS